MLYLSVLISPLLSLILIFYLKKYYGKDWFKVLLNAFLLGIIIIIIPLIFQFIAGELGYDKLKNLKRILFYSFILIGFFSEVGKFLILRYYVFPKKTFDGPSDGIIFSVIISLGFSSIANILYVFDLFDSADMNPTLAHAYTAGLANIFFAIAMGFFVGMAKLGHNKFLNTMGGLAAAVLFHGLYDFCLITRDYKLLSVVVFGFMFLSILLIIQTAKGKIEDKRTKVNKP